MPPLTCGLLILPVILLPILLSTNMVRRLSERTWVTVLVIDLISTSITFAWMLWFYKAESLSPIQLAFLFVEASIPTLLGIWVYRLVDHFKRRRHNLNSSTGL